MLPTGRTPRATGRQRGAAFFVLLLLVATALGAAVFSFSRSNTVALDRARINEQALGKARDALVAFAVRGDNGGAARPGQFPCPDTNSDGVAEGACSGAGGTTIGRIPWRTLGIPEPRDASGETLWYWLGDAFRIGQQVNSDNRGSRNVTGSDGTGLSIADAVAIVFAPGSPVVLSTGVAQRRDAGNAACAARGGASIAQNECADNYLDLITAGNNASTTTPAASVPQSNTFNDRLMIITTKDFLPAIEERAARIIRSALSNYLANGFLPFASLYTAGPDHDCTPGQRRGRLPKVLGTCPAHPDWVGSLPDWFKDYYWNRGMYYAVAPGYVQGAIPPASCGGGCLTVRPVAGADYSNVAAVFFTPGTPLTPPAPAAPARPSNVLSDYLEDAENRDGWGVGANDLYVVPSATGRDRDRIYFLDVTNPGSPVWRSQ